MQKTGNAKNQTKIAKEKELISLAYNDLQIRKYTDTNPVLEIQGAIVKENAKEEWKIEFTDTKNRYNLSKGGEIKEAKPTITIAYEDGKYAEKTKYEASTVEYEYIKVNNGKLEMDINKRDSDDKFKFTSNIQKYQNMIDMVNGGVLIDINEFVPSFFVDSNWKVVKDFNNLSNNDYYLFIVKNEEEQNDLMSGNYVMEYDCGWITEWFDKPLLYKDDLIGRSGIEETEYGVSVANGQIVSYTEDGFEELLSSFKQLIKTGRIVLNNVEEFGSLGFVTHIEEYIDSEGNKYGSIYKGLAISSRPVIRFGGHIIDGVVYDAERPIGTEGLDSPEMIRLKSTKEEVQQSEYDAGFTYNSNNGEWKHTPPLNEYEYRFSNKFYTFEKGHQITID